MFANSSSKFLSSRNKNWKAWYLDSSKLELKTRRTQPLLQYEKRLVYCIHIDRNQNLDFQETINNEYFLVSSYREHVCRGGPTINNGKV